MTGLFPNYPGVIPTGNEITNVDLPYNTSGAGGMETGVMSAMQLAGSQSMNFKNLLKGGDFSTNPWCRGTSFTSITSTPTYTADRWFAVGGASSSISVSRQAVTNGALPYEGFSYALQFGRAAANSNTAVINLGQALETMHSIQAQGDQLVLSFYAQPGANFSAAGGFLGVQIITGTGTDQSAANMVAGSWTGYSSRQVSTVANASYGVGANAGGNPTTGVAYGPVLTNTTGVTLVSGWQRYFVTASIPQGATQLGVLLSYTPVGTAGANDWVQFAGLQLEVVGSGTNLGNTVATGMMPFPTVFEHRTAATEIALCQRYAASWAEPAAGAAIATGMQTGASAQKVLLPLPATMRIAPTMTIPTAGTFRVNIAGTATAVTLSAATSTPTTGSVTGATAGTAGQAVMLEGNGGAGLIVASAEL